jgi:broad specificity phosphatase PhoE
MWRFVAATSTKASGRPQMKAWGRRLREEVRGPADKDHASDLGQALDRLRRLLFELPERRVQAVQSAVPSNA